MSNEKELDDRKEKERRFIDYLLNTLAAEGGSMDKGWLQIAYYKEFEKEGDNVLFRYDQILDSFLSQRRYVEPLGKAWVQLTEEGRKIVACGGMAKYRRRNRLKNAFIWLMRIARFFR